MALIRDVVGVRRPVPVLGHRPHADEHGEHLHLRGRAALRRAGHVPARRRPPGHRVAPAPRPALPQEGASRSRAASGIRCSSTTRTSTSPTTSSTSSSTRRATTSSSSRSTRACTRACSTTPARCGRRPSSTGLEGGRVGMVQKIHHAPFDGASTVDVLYLLFDATPEHSDGVEAPPWKPEPAPDPWVLMGAKWGEQVSTMWKHAARRAAVRADRCARTARRARRGIERARADAQAAGHVVEPVGRAAPALRLGPHVARRAQEDPRALVPGSTVNDVMLTVVAAACESFSRPAARTSTTSCCRPWSRCRCARRWGVGAGNMVSGFVGAAAGVRGRRGRASAPAPPLDQGAQGGQAGGRHPRDDTVGRVRARVAHGSRRPHSRSSRARS